MSKSVFEKGKVSSKDGTIISYEKSGDGSLIILIDGAMAHRAYRGSRPLASELSNMFTVLTYDRRGRGQSTNTLPYAIEREIEDIETLIDKLALPANLYGFSSGAVLALRAAAALKDKVNKIVAFEPPFNADDSFEAKQEFLQYAEKMQGLINENDMNEAVSYFLKDMVPEEVLDQMKKSPEWKSMEKVAPTLVYDNFVMGDGGVPGDWFTTIKQPVLVVDGELSPPFKNEAANLVAENLSNSKRFTLKGHDTLAEPKDLAPILRNFFT